VPPEEVEAFERALEKIPRKDCFVAKYGVKSISINCRSRRMTEATQQKAEATQQKAEAMQSS